MEENFKRALKTKSSISHVISVMCEEENNNSPLVSSLQPPLPPPANTYVPLASPTALPDATYPLAPTNATISQLAMAFLSLSTTINLNSILNNVS